jgi:hypothetical protein
MAGLLAVVELAVEPEIGADVEIAPELIALLVELVRVGPGRRRENRKAAQFFCRGRRGGDAEIPVIGVVVAKSHFPVQRQVNLAVGVAIAVRMRNLSGSKKSVDLPGSRK